MTSPKAKRTAEIQDAFRQVLFRDWDPIGVNDNLNLQDEYDAYIAPVYGILSGSRSEQELVDFLFRTTGESMGLQCDSSERFRPIARKLLELDIALWCTRMSSTFSTVFQSDVPPYGTLGSDHVALNRAREQLDPLAAAAGLTSLLAFESYEPEAFEGLLDEDFLAQQPPAKWFAPAAGLAAVDALLAHLDAHPGALPQQAAVQQDLVEIADELRAAERAGIRFRFAVIT